MQCQFHVSGNLTENAARSETKLRFELPAILKTRSFQALFLYRFPETSYQYNNGIRFPDLT